jgi:hypothetical protein
VQRTAFVPEPAGWRELMRLLDERELDPFDLAREALL